jgi:predicted small metal-binding protein
MGMGFDMYSILSILEVLLIINQLKMKQVKCADLGNDCDFVAKGSVEEVMAQVADHATGVHKMSITEDVVAAVKGVMTDV